MQFQQSHCNIHLFPDFNRWCMRDGSLTTPLAYVITNNSSFGTSIAVAASTNWTKLLRQSPCSAMRGHPSLRSECTMHASSKVHLSSLWPNNGYNLTMIMLQTILLLLYSHCLLFLSLCHLCRHQCVPS